MHQNSSLASFSSFSQKSFALSNSQFLNHTSQQKVLFEQLTNAEAEAQHYQKLYHETKMINGSIIQAIKRVFSKDIGEEIENLIDNRNSFGFLSFSKGPCNNSKQLTENFCEMMISFGSRVAKSYSRDHSFTPGKSSFQGDYLDNSRFSQYSSNQKKNTSKICDSQRNKIDQGEISTRRSSTPIKNIVATQLLCELCERTFPPNIFITHAQQCKYEINYDQSLENSIATQKDNYSQIYQNYEKMMRNLFKIREDIENQIKLINFSKEQIDRVNQKKKLEKELKKVNKVISQKQEEIKYKKSSSLGTPMTKPKKNRKNNTGKLR